MKHYSIGNDEMPAVGLGTWKMEDGVATDAIQTAFDVGYRHFDCAAIYNNESDIGIAMKQLLAGDSATREEMWVTSKLWCNRHRPDLVESALKQTLQDLSLDYLDLYMIHWPIVFRHDLDRPESGEDFIPLSEMPLTETWEALERCVQAGLCRHLGVCNFNSSNLELIRTNGSIKPAVNQVECHPYLPQNRLKAYCDQHGIQMVAYSPLGSGDRPERMRDAEDPNLFEDPTLIEVAKRNQITIGQAILAWLINRGMVVIPKSSNPGRMRENLLAGDVELSPDDIQAIDQIDRSHRFVHGRFWEMKGSPYLAADLWEHD